MQPIRTSTSPIATLVLLGLLLAAPTTATAGAQARFVEPTADAEFVPDAFESYTLVLLRKGDAWTAEETPESAELQAQHLAHLGRLWKSGRIVIAGPFGEQDDESFRGLCLYRAPLEEARKLAEADPAVQAGQLRVEAMTWWIGEGQLAFPKLPTQEVVGTARNAKGGAVVVLDDGGVVYIQGLDAWPDELDGQVVIATGHMVEKAYLPEATVDEEGAISQGTTAGSVQTVLEDATWTAGLRGGSR